MSSLLLIATTTFHNSLLATSPKLKEDITIEFSMDNDYKMKVQGFVHLTNLSGKDITIDNYSLKIPYYLLKNTKVTLIDPKNFLIDTYTEKGSTLFTIKSPYSKPSIISKSRKIIFSFTAEIANPYTDFSGFREVDFPFSTPESENKTYIYFSFPKDLPLIYPSKNEITVGQTSGKYEIEITDTAPKSYIFFRDNSKIALKHVSRSGNLLLLGKSLFPCSKHEFVSCTDCGEGYLENENVSFVHPNGDILSHITQYTANKECYFNSEKVTNLPNFVLGYVINPTDRKVNLAILGKQISGTTEKFTYPNKREVPSPLIIPLSTCDTAEECQSKFDSADKTEISIITESMNGKEIQMRELSPDETGISLGESTISVRNNADSLGIINSLSILSSFLNVPQTFNRVIPPGKMLTINAERTVMGAKITSFEANINNFAKTVEVSDPIAKNTYNWYYPAFAISIGLFIIGLIYNRMNNVKNQYYRK